MIIVSSSTGYLKSGYSVFRCITSVTPTFFNKMKVFRNMAGLKVESLSMVKVIKNNSDFSTVLSGYVNHSIYDDPDSSVE
jgi:hypothetical protein